MDWIGVVADAIGEFVHTLIEGYPVQTIIGLCLLAVGVFLVVRHYYF
ncbi:MAG: hypothetical protein ACLQGP_11540 [Isosphaeraceae bacterium]